MVWCCRSCNAGVLMIREAKSNAADRLSILPQVHSAIELQLQYLNAPPSESIKI